MHIFANYINYSHKNKARIALIHAARFVYHCAAEKCVLFEKTGRQCLSSNALCHASLVQLARNTYVLTHHCVDVP